MIVGVDPVENIPEHLRENFVELDKFPDFSTGGAGFGLSGYTALFDNVTITGNGIPNRGGFSSTAGETRNNVGRFKAILESPHKMFKKIRSTHS